ncbi:MAG: hypothetical protein U0527_12775 [Candidatus Eisenbacteria bacterium]
MTKGMRLASVLPVLSLFGLCASLDARTAAAIPRYSARYEQNCALCHVNPSGGGLRTAYATQYLAPVELTLKPYKPEALSRIDPQISKSLLIGADFRQMFHYSKDHTEYPAFTMQGDFYAQFQADDRVLLYFDKGMSRSTEAFGIGYFLPWTGYVKVGRFTPSFGWRFDDHTAFVRQEIGLFPPGDSDQGVEVGIAPGRLEMQVGVLNGALGASSDDDKRLSQSVNATYRLGLASIGMPKVGVGLGAGYWHNQGAGGTRSTGGPHTYLKLGPVIWMAETDWSRVEAENDTHTELLSSHELTYEYLRGMYFKVTYDFKDPDIDRESGSRSRLGVGYEALPIPSVGIKAMWNVFRHGDAKGSGDAPAPFLGDEYDQLEVQLHLYY